MALPRMTATRSSSTFHFGQPACISAPRDSATDHFWPSSSCSLTFGGMGSRHFIGSHSKSRTQPPSLV